ncbi:nucleoside hydrolase [Allorhizobium sp. BGMRC 0089]|uniref:nucleoside hydrolase n=1 Tax=Allorhizobium sonneratiae TaxID=2934936 RepID=UPI002033E8B8|nr:nucleoside hydrolase [Allorhizobium sonneratiae]MCM2292367.1 nucleoside hydrolase [Allorhizobium sonneratiae]
MSKVIFDTDPGVDDAAALLFLSACPNIRLVGITTVFGNSDIETVTRNALYLKKRFSIAAPVAKGAEGPLVGQAAAVPAHIHGQNGLGDIELDERALPLRDERPAHRFIIDMVKANPGEITLLAVGRLTNLALALKEAPEIASLVREVVIMGGAFSIDGHNGNVTPVAEANIIGDPHAADEVFSAAWPVTAIGLDVTRKVVLGPAELARLETHGGAAGRFIVDSSRGYRLFHKQFGIDGYWVHDSTAAIYLASPGLFRLRKGPVRVVTEGIAIGQTIQRDWSKIYPAGEWDMAPDQNVAIDVDARRAVDLLLGIHMPSLTPSMVSVK